MLYRPEQFDPLTDTPWDEARVRDAIARIARAADDAYDPRSLWPAHEWDGWSSQLPMTNLYVGAAGVLWALDALARRGYVQPQLDLAAAARRTLELWRAAPDAATFPGAPAGGDAALWEGESGILLVAYRLAPAADLADALHARVLENVASEANELMWGAPGTMLAAHAMLQWTGEERWRDAWRECADELLRRADADGLWTQDLYGEQYRGLGAAHGAAGNAAALLQDDVAGRDELLARLTATLSELAVREDGLANWPGTARPELESSDGQIRLQWDATGPGIVALASSYLEEDVLLAGAELTWRAGAHRDEKGAGLCHGTAGNGYALLKTFARTGDERWLERARRFAVHALEQAERLPPRYSLFTGGIGAALFAAGCVEARAGFPTVDFRD